ncbi:MAG: DUF1611 domain-containing protein [Thermoplasmata archaeon]
MVLPRAVILAEGVYGNLNGKTAHGLVRFSKRFSIVAVIDSEFEGMDAGEVLDGKFRNIPIVGSLKDSLKFEPEVLIIGAATDGGFLPKNYRPIIIEALRNGLDIVSGLHEFISDDEEFLKLAEFSGSKIIDVRKMYLKKQEFFTGEIENVLSTKVAVLGSDSAIGKRTTTIMITEKLKELGYNAVFIATGQTGWMQGAEYCALIDAMINDFVAGGIESEVVRAWKEKRPDFILIEGQGGLLHPAYPGGFEIIAAARPEAIVFQHSPKRIYYDGFEKYRIPDLDKFIQLIEILSGRKPIGITLNTEKIEEFEIPYYISEYEEKYSMPVDAPLYTGVEKIAKELIKLHENRLDKGIARNVFH